MKLWLQCLILLTFLDPHSPKRLFLRHEEVNRALFYNNYRSFSPRLQPQIRLPGRLRPIRSQQKRGVQIHQNQIRFASSQSLQEKEKVRFPDSTLLVNYLFIPAFAVCYLLYKAIVM